MILPKFFKKPHEIENLPLTASSKQQSTFSSDAFKIRNVVVVIQYQFNVSLLPGADLGFPAGGAPTYDFAKIFQKNA